MNARRHVDRFRRAGAETRVVDDLLGESTFGGAVRRVAATAEGGGVIVLGSGAVPLATAADRLTFVTAAGGPPGHVLANNRFSADIVAIAGADGLSALPELRSDNGLPRWLADEAGFVVADLAGRWRLQVDIDSPLDAFLVSPAMTATELEAADAATNVVDGALRAVAVVGRDPKAELVIAGRASAAGLAWLERSTASRTRALIEERGFRTRPADQRPARSVLGIVLDRDGPEALGPRLAELGDGALIDSRVLLAHRLGTDERRWPTAEDRYASDLLLPDRVQDPWLRALTASARDASIPIVLGGHSLVGPGLRLVLGGSRRRRARVAWT
jgi:hypothetical protein